MMTQRSIGLLRTPKNRSTLQNLRTRRKNYNERRSRPTTGYMCQRNTSQAVICSADVFKRSINDLQWWKHFPRIIDIDHPRPVAFALVTRCSVCTSTDRSAERIGWRRIFSVRQSADRRKDEGDLASDRRACSHADTDRDGVA